MTAELVGIHPYAEKFPMLSDGELDELAESIASIGLINPIVVDSAGLILDGRNRMEACNRAGVEVQTKVYEGSDIAEFVIGCNVTRRNMSTGARAMATALVLEADGRRKDGRWRRGSVVNPDIGINDGKTWQNLLNQAGVILDFKPDLAADVVAGAVTLNDAFTQAEQIRTSAERKKIMAGIGRGRSGGTVARLHERRVLLRQPCQLRSRLTHRRRHVARLGRRQLAVGLDITPVRHRAVLVLPSADIDGHAVEPPCAALDFTAPSGGSGRRRRWRTCHQSVPADRPGRCRRRPSRL